MDDVRIKNVVAVASLDQKMDLIAIAQALGNVEYRPKKFPGLVFRLKRPKTATLIFKTGKMVCTGAKSEQQARNTVHKVIRELKKAGFTIRGRPKITIENMVASAYLGRGVDIERASEVLENIMYEPEQFPGAIYRMDEPKVVILIFRSGKLVITGAKKKEQAHEAMQHLERILMAKDLLF